MCASSMACSSGPREPTFVCGLSISPKELPQNTLGRSAQSHNSLVALKLLYLSATAALLRIRAPAAEITLRELRASGLQTRPCMLSRGVASHTKHPRPTAIAADAYRSVVCTYFCAALLWRVVATILETCSLSELLKGRALRAVPSLGTASYKTCHRKQRWSKA